MRKLLSVFAAFAMALTILTGSIALPLLIRPFYRAQIEPLGIPARSGLTAVKSEKVDAPVVQEFPLTLECKVVEDKMEVYGHHVLGEIVGVLADESVLDETGKVDASKLNAFVFDQFRSGYYAIGEKVGQAWHPRRKMNGGGTLILAYCNR